MTLRAAEERTGAEGKRRRSPDDREEELERAFDAVEVCLRHVRRLGRFWRWFPV